MTHRDSEGNRLGHIDLLYDEKGNQTDSVILNPDSGTYGISIPAGQWHNSKANVPTVIIESKAGHYKPLEPADILIPEA